MNPETRVFIAKDGEEYRFLFNHRGLIASERAAGGVGIAKLLSGLAESNLGYVAALIQGGLVSDRPEMTFDDAWGLWEAEGEKVVKAMAEALESAMPLVAKMTGVKLRPRSGAPKAQTTPRGTGTRSSQRGAKAA